LSCISVILCRKWKKNSEFRAVWTR